MAIQYIEPLSRGISRMRKDLFSPLDFNKWFVVGFTAFLAGLADLGFSGSPGFSKHSDIDLETVLYFPQRAMQWLKDHPGLAILIGILLLLIIMFGILLAWLSSRGKFMFLDNVVHRSARVAAPWREYSREGNSFFLVTLVWGLLASAIVVAYVAYCFVSLQSVYESGGNGRTLIVPALLAGLGLFGFSMINFFIYAILKDFVVPIMYRDRTSALEAIQKFSPLFLSHFFYFVFYAIFLFCLTLLVVVGIFLSGCITCCIGFLILMIPYINSVVLLPVSYALRAFSVEFLEQFGPEFHIFPKPDAAFSDGHTLIG